MKIIYHHRTRSTDAQRIHIQELVRAFSELGHDVEVVSLVPTNASEEDASRDAGEAAWKGLARRVPFAYEIIQLGYNLIGLPMLFARVVRSRADFIYERYSLFNFTGVLVARLCGLPIILEVNSPFALEQSRDRDIRLHKLANRAERAICNLATRVIVVSTPLARIMRRAGVNPEKLEVMSNGVCLEKFQPHAGSPKLRQALGLGNDVVIGFVGWFRNWHGLDLLIDAYDRSGLKREGAKILLIGDGPAMAELQQLVAARDLAGSVIFTGPLPHARVPEHLDLIDIAVQPAANEYCCPMKILEYMALGKPVVAPRQENIVELLREGAEGLFFEQGDADSLAGALRTLVRDRERARHMGENARAAITGRDYLWTGNARRVLDFVSRYRAASVSGRLANCRYQDSNTSSE